MTFYEAAKRVLSLLGRPAHYKEITEIAIKSSLLSHVGRTPDLTMGSRLVYDIDRNGLSSDFRSYGQGIFGLQEWPEKLVGGVVIEQSVVTSSDDISVIFSKDELEVEVDSVEDVIDQYMSLSVSLWDSANKVTDEYIGNSVSEIVPAVTHAYEQEIEESRLEESLVESEPLVSYSESSFHLSSHVTADEHYNLCAALVEILRSSDSSLSSEDLSSELHARFGIEIPAESIVLAMRSENSLRSARGKRKLFIGMDEDLWLLHEEDYPRQVLRLESRLYEQSRQLHSHTLSHLVYHISRMRVNSWHQLGRVLLKSIHCRVIQHVCHDQRVLLLKVEQERGLNYSPCLVSVIHGVMVSVEDVISLRKMLVEMKLDYGMIFSNGHFNRDAVSECNAEVPIYGYGVRQCAELMLEANLGVCRYDLPLVFLDKDFFKSL